MDAGEALRHDGADAEMERRKDGLLPARALPVVVAADDDAAAPLLGASRAVGIEAAEHVAGAGRDVRPDGDAERTVRRHVAGRDVVRNDDQHAALDRLRQRRYARAGRRCSPAARPRPARFFLGRARRSAGRRRKGPARARYGQLGRLTELARVGDRAARAPSPPPSPASRGTRGRSAVPLRPGKFRLKVRTETAPLAGAWPHPDARPAGGLEHARARGEQLGVDPAAHDQVEDLARAWRDGQVEPVRDGASRRTAATMARSSNDELTELPTQTCVVAMPAASRTGTTLPGDEGRQSVARARRARSPPPRRSGARGSAASSTNSSPRPCRSSHSLRAGVAGEDPGRRTGLHHHVADRSPVGRRTGPRRLPR